MELVKMKVKLKRNKDNTKYRPNSIEINAKTHNNKIISMKIQKSKKETKNTPVK